MNDRAVKEEEDEEIEVPRGPGRPKKRQSTTTDDSDDEDAGKVYCLCKGKAGTRFMIQCDKCEEWYHGECIQVSKIYAARIEKYYCPPCISNAEDLQIVFKEKVVAKERVKKEVTESKENAAVVEEKPATKCGECLACFKREDCKTCNGCRSGKACDKRRCLLARIKTEVDAPRKAGGGSVLPVKPATDRRKTKVTVSDSEGEKDDDKDDDFVMQSAKVKFEDGSLEKGKRGRKKGWRKEIEGVKSCPPPPRDPRIDTRTLDQRIDNASMAISNYQQMKAKTSPSKGKRAAKKRPPVEEDLPQCLGPGCIYEARKHSKYCSEACGVKLAEKRIMGFLPQGLQNYWEDAPVAQKRIEMAQEHLSRELEITQKESGELTDRLHVLEKYLHAMEQLVPDEDDDEKDTQDNEPSYSCSVCTMEVPARSLSKHTERCFVRNEKQISFGTTQVLFNPQKLFCDEYNKTNNTYCRRLRVICAEHYKGEIENKLKVCGFPKYWNTATDSITIDELLKTNNITSKGFCMIARRGCSAHHRWIQVILGHLENRRHALLMRIDELTERRLCLEMKEKLRGDAISLMIGRTTYKEPLEKILAEYDAGERKASAPTPGSSHFTIL